MGPRLKLPRYVHGFIDRHGKPRFYFRRAGFKKTPLPGLPWSPEFMAAYEVATRDQPVQVGSSRVLPGTIRALAVCYYNSAAFRSMGDVTQGDYRAVIDRFCREVGKDNQPYGDKRVATLRSEHIVKLMAVRKANSANALRKVLRAMMKHAIELKMRTDDPTRDVKAIRIKTDGYHSWTDVEIEQFEARHPIGTRARLALALMLYTGQRRGDVVRMGRQHLRPEGIYVRQQKTGVELLIPVHPNLAPMLAAAAEGRMTFVITEDGKPFSVRVFGNWFRDMCDMANLHHCSAHGLRKAAARRLAEAGCTAHEIAAITGHASLREIVRYTKAADQKRLAAAAMTKQTARKIG
jgi:integrase